MSDNKEIQQLVEQLKTVSYWKIQIEFSGDKEKIKLLETAQDIRNRHLSRDILQLIDGKDIKCIDEIYGEYRKKEIINVPLNIAFGYAITDANIIDSEHYIEDTLYLKDDVNLVYFLTKKNIKLFKGIEYCNIKLFKFKELVDYFHDVYGDEQIITIIKKLFDKWMDNSKRDYYDIESLKFLLIDYKLREHPLYEEYIKNLDPNNLQKLSSFINDYNYEWDNGISYNSSGYKNKYINFAGLELDKRF